MVHSDEEINQKLEKIFLEVFEIDTIDMNATIDDVPEWDSFGHFELMMGIEKQFDIKKTVNWPVVFRCNKLTWNFPFSLHLLM